MLKREKQKQQKKKQTDLVNIILILICAIIMTGVLYKVYDYFAPSLELKKETEQLKEIAGGSDVDFDRLRKINPDICAWITIDNTGIDYPVVQGSNNMEYLNRSAYGENAVYGALFLDSRNDMNFRDPYSLIYGHHMSDGNMFGDLDLFREKKFFMENGTGTLKTPNETFRLRSVALVSAKSDDSYIYYPEKWQNSSVRPLAKYIRTAAMYRKKMKQGKRLLALSTCYRHGTDNRTVLVLEMTAVSRNTK